PRGGGGSDLSLVSAAAGKAGRVSLARLQVQAAGAQPRRLQGLAYLPGALRKRPQPCPPVPGGGAPGGAPPGPGPGPHQETGRTDGGQRGSGDLAEDGRRRGEGRGLEARLKPSLAENVILSEPS